MRKLFAAAALLILTSPLAAQDQNAAPAANAAAPAAANPAAPAADAAAAAPAAKKAGGDEDGVKKTFEDVSTAWSSGDTKALTGLFTADGSLINPMGQAGHGHKEIQAVMDGEFAGPMKGTQQTFDDFTIRFYPMPNIALVDCTGTVTGMKKPDGTDAGATKTHVFGILVNRSGKKWQALLIRAYAFLPGPDSSSASAAPAAAPAAAADSSAPAASAASAATTAGSASTGAAK